MEREPPRASPAASRPGAAANSAAARALLSPRYDGAPRPPPGARDGGGGGGGGGMLPALTPAAQVAPPSGARGASPSSFKRTGWATPRSPGDADPKGGVFPGIEPPQRQRSRSLLNDASATDSDPDWDAFYQSKTAPRRHEAPEKTRQMAHAESAHTHDMERNQLAYMEEMYNTINALNEELEKERADRVRLEERASINWLVDESECAPYGAISALTPTMTELDEAAYGFTPMPPNSITSPRRFKLTPSPPQLHQPKRPGGASTSTSQLAKDQVELCSALGKNAELRIRTREMERTAEKSTQELEQTQKQMKLAERRINNREEKLRGLLKEKMHWQKELKDMRDQVVEEKMRQVDIFRRMEVLKREHTTSLEEIEATLRDADAENEELRGHVAELRAQHSYQARWIEEMARQAKEEKDNFAAYIAETRQRFKEWKDNETSTLRTARDQALSNLKTEYDLKIARHQEEKQKLRDKVKDLEVSVKLMQKDRSLSPLELRLRKATILGSRDSSVTSEAELIEAHARIRELETLLDHAQEYQKRQDNIIKVSEATISRLVQEREVTALENMSSHTLSTKSPSLGGDDSIAPTLDIPYTSRFPREIRKPSQSPRISSPPRPSRSALPEPRANHPGIVGESSSGRGGLQERKQPRVSTLDAIAPIPITAVPAESGNPTIVMLEVVPSPAGQSNSNEDLLLKELAQLRDELEQVKRRQMQPNATAAEKPPGINAVCAETDAKPSNGNVATEVTNDDTSLNGEGHDPAGVSTNPDECEASDKLNDTVLVTEENVQVGANYSENLLMSTAPENSNLAWEEDEWKPSNDTDPECDNSTSIFTPHTASDEILTHVKCDMGNAEVQEIQPITIYETDEIPLSESDGLKLFTSTTEEASAMSERADAIENQDSKALDFDFPSGALPKEISADSTNEQEFVNDVSNKHAGTNDADMTEPREVMMDIKHNTFDECDGKLEIPPEDNESEDESNSKTFDLNLSADCSDVDRLLNEESSTADEVALAANNLTVFVDEVENVISSACTEVLSDNDPLMSSSSTTEEITEPFLLNEVVSVNEGGDTNESETLDHPQGEIVDKPIVEEPFAIQDSSMEVERGDCVTEPINEKACIDTMRELEKGESHLILPPISPDIAGNASGIKNSISRSDIAWVAATPSDWLLPSELSTRDEETKIAARSADEGSVNLDRLNSSLVAALPQQGSMEDLATIRIQSVENEDFSEEAHATDASKECELLNMNDPTAPETDVKITGGALVEADKATLMPKHLSDADEFAKDCHAIDAIVLSLCIDNKLTHDGDYLDSKIELVNPSSHETANLVYEETTRPTEAKARCESVEIPEIEKEVEVTQVVTENTFCDSTPVNYVEFTTAHDVKSDPVVLPIPDIEMEINESIEAIMEAVTVFNSSEDPAEVELIQVDEILQPLIGDDDDSAVITARLDEIDTPCNDTVKRLEGDIESEEFCMPFDEQGQTNVGRSSIVSNAKVYADDEKHVNLDTQEVSAASLSFQQHSPNLGEPTKPKVLARAPTIDSDESEGDDFTSQLRLAAIRHVAEDYYSIACSQAVAHIVSQWSSNSEVCIAESNDTASDVARYGHENNALNQVRADTENRTDKENGLAITSVPLLAEYVETAGLVAAAFVTQVMERANHFARQMSFNKRNEPSSAEPGEECDEMMFYVDFDVLVLMADMLQEVLLMNEKHNAFLEVVPTESGDNQPSSDAGEMYCDSDCSAKNRSNQGQQQDIILLVAKNTIGNITDEVVKKIAEDNSASLMGLAPLDLNSENLAQNEAINSPTSVRDRLGADNEIPADTVAGFISSTFSAAGNQKVGHHDCIELKDASVQVAHKLAEEIVFHVSTKALEKICTDRLVHNVVEGLMTDLSAVEKGVANVLEEISSGESVLVDVEEEIDGDDTFIVLAALNTLCSETEALVYAHGELQYNCENSLPTSNAYYSPEINPYSREMNAYSPAFNACETIIVPYDADECLESMLLSEQHTVTQNYENESNRGLEAEDRLCCTAEIYDDVAKIMESIILGLEAICSPAESIGSMSSSNTVLISNVDAAETGEISTCTNKIRPNLTESACTISSTSIVDDEVRTVLIGICIQVQQLAVVPIAQPVSFSMRRSSQPTSALPTLFERPKGMTSTSSPVEGRRASTRRKTKRSGSILAAEQLLAWDLSPQVVDATESTVKKYATKRRVSRRGTNEPLKIVNLSDVQNPHLLAYDMSSEHGAHPFSLIDDSLLKIDPHARHIELEDEPEPVSEIIAKRKKLHYEAYCKFLAQRRTPAFNYAPVLIKFEWSDFVVATPAGPSAAASPVQKMRLLIKKGVQLPCGQYVIVSAFVRPLEDGNENLRVQIYDSERVEEFLFDFYDDHIKKYVIGWTGTDDQIRGFVAQLEFRREHLAIIIKLPEKKGQLSPNDQRFLSDNSTERKVDDESRVGSSIVMEPDGSTKAAEPRTPRSAPRRRTLLNQRPATSPNLQLNELQEINDSRQHGLLRTVPDASESSAE